MNPGCRNIMMQVTADPAVWKFFPGCEMSTLDEVCFDCVASAEGYPLARALLGLGGVARVSFCKDFVRITRTADADWGVLRIDVCVAIDGFLQPALEAYQDDQVSQKLRRIVASKVAPAIAGGVIYLGWEAGRVYLRFTDACSGCKYSGRNLSAMICRLLKHYVPEVEEVVMV